MSRPTLNLAVFAAALAAAAALSQAQTMYAIGNGGSALVRFTAASPGGATVVANFSGAATFLDALAYRPATGQLYGYLDSADAFYIVNTTTGALTLDSVVASAAATNTFFLGLAFNPSVDKARIVTDSGQNIVFDPAAHTVSAATDLAYLAGDPNQDASPMIIENAYTQNFAALGGATQQYGIDYGTDALVKIANNAGTLTTVGPLGVDTSAYTGFDIATSAGGADTAYAILTPPTGGPSLYTINLTTGAATSIGALGIVNQVYGLAIVQGAAGGGGGTGGGNNGFGVCCINGLSCAMASPSTCKINRGVYQGDGTTCNAAVNPCAPVLGACCIPRSTSTFFQYPGTYLNYYYNYPAPGSCIATTLTSCASYSGNFHGNGTTCTPTSPCPPPPATTGACCSLNASNQAICRQDTPGGCTSSYATFTGLGVACSTAACPQPALGACCRNFSGSNTCIITSQVNCGGGTYQGDASACLVTTCPQLTRGACCFAATYNTGSICSLEYAYVCTTSGGTFYAASTTCQASPCVITCPCDWNHDGYLTSYDLSQFLSDYFAGRADFDNNGTTNAADYTAFLSCYQGQSGCFRR